jgi:hypothetical protein
VTLRPDEKSSMDVLFGFIDESYRAVAPKRALAKLPQP